MPIIASTNTVLESIDSAELQYFEFSNVACFMFMALLPIPMVSARQGFIVDFFKELRFLIALSFGVSSLISILTASSSSSLLFYLSQMGNVVVSSILFPAIVKHLSLVWPSHLHGFIFSCLAAQVPLGYAMTTITIPLCSYVR